MAFAAKPVQLWTTQGADGQTEWVESPGGTLAFYITGTFGSGTVKVEVSPDGGTTVFDDKDASSVTAEGILHIPTAKGEFVRLDLAGATSPSINAWVGFLPL